MSEAGAHTTGRITASYRRSFQVSLDDGTRLTCITKGRKLDAACGDVVELTREAQGRGVVTGIAPRSSLLYRADHIRQKTLAANATQMVAVVAPQPRFNDELLTRCVVAAEAAQLQVLVVCNKSDLPDSAQAWDALAPYRALGYRCVALSARSDCGALHASLRQQVSVLVGQSGMGKSTIINALLPHSNAATREISLALGSGKHTTTAAAWYALDADSAIIDTPGLQQFGLAHLDARQLLQAFPEFRACAGRCRFTNCGHDSEPDCALQSAVASGAASEQRLRALRTLLAESVARKPWQ